MDRHLHGNLKMTIYKLNDFIHCLQTFYHVNVITDISTDISVVIEIDIVANTLVNINSKN